MGVEIIPTFPCQSLVPNHFTILFSRSVYLCIYALFFFSFSNFPTLYISFLFRLILTRTLWRENFDRRSCLTGKLLEIIILLNYREGVFRGDRMMDAFLTGEVDSKNPYLELPQPRVNSSCL